MPDSILKFAEEFRNHGIGVIEGTPQVSTRNERKRQDVCCFVFFVFMLIALGGIAAFVIINGDLGRYIYGVDSWGNVCGREDNLPINGAKHSGKDHSSRPREFRLISNDIRVAYNPEVAYKEKFATLCIEECKGNQQQCATLLKDNEYDLEKTIVDKVVCTMLLNAILPQRQFYGSCIPAELKENSSQALISAIISYEKSVNASGPGLDVYKVPSGETEVVSLTLRILLPALQNCITEVIVMVFIALLLTLGLVALIQYQGRFVLTGAACMVCGISCIFSLVLWYNYAIKPPFQEYDFDRTVFNLDLDNLNRHLRIQSFSQFEYLLPICILSSVVSLIIVMSLIALRTRFLPYLQFLDETSTFSLFGVPVVFVYPVITVIFAFGVMAFFFCIGLYILTVRNPVVDDDEMVTFVPRYFPRTWLLLVVHILGCIWFMEFIIGCQDVIMAGTCCRWYFSRFKRQVKFQVAPLVHSTKSLLLYGLGTVAFGSLIINFIQICRVLTCGVCGVDDARKNQEGNCCNYVSHRAYVCAAMYGQDFAECGKLSDILLLRYRYHYMTLSSVLGLSLFLCKVLVVAIILMISIIWFQGKIGQDLPSVEYLFPLLIICVAAYIIATCFLRIFASAFDTIFLCFCDDIERFLGLDLPSLSAVKNYGSLFRDEDDGELLGLQDLQNQIAKRLQSQRNSEPDLNRRPKEGLQNLRDRLAERLKKQYGKKEKPPPKEITPKRQEPEQRGPPPKKSSKQKLPKSKPKEDRSRRVSFDKEIRLPPAPNPHSKKLQGRRGSQLPPDNEKPETNPKMYRDPKHPYEPSDGYPPFPYFWT